MALSSHITDLIKAYKAMPNGERRNKIVSHLKDAEAHARLLEIEDPRLRSPAEDASLDAQAPAIPRPSRNNICICKPGMKRKDCTAAVHVA